MNWWDDIPSPQQADPAPEQADPVAGSAPASVGVVAPEGYAADGSPGFVLGFDVGVGTVGNAAPPPPAPAPVAQPVTGKNPTRYPLTQTVTVPVGNAAPLVFDFGAPPLGKVWEVRSVLYSDAATLFATVGSASGFAGFAVGFGEPGTVPSQYVASPPIVNNFDMPVSATYGAGHIKIPPMAHLLVAIVAPNTGGQILQCRVEVDMFTPDVYGSEYGL